LLKREGKGVKGKLKRAPYQKTIREKSTPNIPIEQRQTSGKGGTSISTKGGEVVAERRPHKKVTILVGPVPTEKPTPKWEYPTRSGGGKKKKKSREETFLAGGGGRGEQPP